MQISRKAGASIIRLLTPEDKSLAHVLDIAETISVQAHDAAPAAKEVVAAVTKLRAALANEAAVKETVPA